MRIVVLLAGALLWMATGCDDVESSSAPPDQAVVDATIDAAPDLAVDAAPDADVDDAAVIDMGGPICGNGTLEPPEACDDGNTAPGDGCDAECALEIPQVVEPDRRGAPLDLRFDADGLAEADFAFEREGDEDWFRFVLDAPIDVAVGVFGVDQDCPGDPEVALFRGDDPAFLLVDDTREFLCPRIGPSGHPEVADLEPGTYYIRVRAADRALEDGLRLRVWRRARIAVGGACDEFSLEGRCAPGVRCARTDVDTGLGVCLAPGCGDWYRDDGEACDGDDGHCTPECTLVAPPEVEPNDTPATATPMGASVEGFGVFANSVTVSALDDLDHLRFSIPDGPPVDVRVGVFDGFFQCPGALQTTILDADGAILGRSDEPCAIVTYPLLPTGADYVLRLNANDVAATGVPLFVFLDLRERQPVGADCDLSRPCTPGAWCVEDRCEADQCGDGRMGPDETCDDGNRAPGDGCDADCQLEEIRIDPPGGTFPFDLMPGETRRFRFSLDAPATIRALTEGVQSCPGDTRVRVFAAGAAAPIAENDDGPGTICADLRAALPAGADYELWIDTPGDRPIFEARLVVEFGPAGAVGDVCGAADMPLCAAGLWCNLEQRCAPLVCGDGELAADEECDDGNQLDGDGCTADCRVEGTPVGDGLDLERPELAGDEIDVFTFEIDQAMRLQVWTDNNRGRCAADTALQLDRLEAGEWQTVAEDDDGGLAVCSRIDRPVPPGRYEILAFGAQGAISPFWIHVRLLPQIADGDPCDRAGRVNACQQDRWCTPTDTLGEGVCAPLAPFVQETEPDLLPDLAQRVRPDVAVRARVEPEFASDDFVDLFVVVLDAPAYLRVQTGDGEDGCPGDTVLHHIDPDQLDQGIDAAIGNALWTADDMEDLRCSEIERTFAAGEHWFAVEAYERDVVLDYVFRARTLSQGEADARCDAAGVFDRCAEPLVCADPDADGDGTCVAPD